MVLRFLGKRWESQDFRVERKKTFSKQHSIGFSLDLYFIVSRGVCVCFYGHVRVCLFVFICG